VASSILVSGVCFVSLVTATKAAFDKPPVASSACVQQQNIPLQQQQKIMAQAIQVRSRTHLCIAARVSKQSNKEIR
jgi:hypothetical protein